MDCKLGFLINWNIKLIKDGIKSALCALRGQLFPLVKPAIRKKIEVERLGNFLNIKAKLEYKDR